MPPASCEKRDHLGLYACRMKLVSVYGVYNNTCNVLQVYPLFVDVNTYADTSILTTKFVESKLDIVVIEIDLISYSNMNGPFSHSRSHLIILLAYKCTVCSF